MYESCLTYEGDMSHMRMSHVAHLTGSCHIRECVTSYIWRGRSCEYSMLISTYVYICIYVYTYICIYVYTSIVHATECIYVCTYIHICIHVNMYICIYEHTIWNLVTHSHVRHDPVICVTWPIHMFDMIHSQMWHNPFICATWLIHICDTTHSYVRHGSSTYVTRSIHMCDKSYVC